VYRKQVRRRRAALALLVISSFALLTATYGDDSGGVQRGVSAVFGPIEEAADRALKPARDLVNWFDETFEARGENKRLQDELEEARGKLAAEQVAVAEGNELRKILGLQRQAVIPAGYEPVSARVIVRSPTVWYSTVTIDRGSSSGIAVDDPVLSAGGLSGRVSSVTGGQAQVTLITDASSAVSAKVVPGGAQGIVKPVVGDPNDLILGLIPAGREVSEGEQVVTAGWRDAEGLASLFPPGIPIGDVTEASQAEQEASQRVHLDPYADLSSFDFVQVLTGGSRG
jgi:rod shape-determining protein MreC